MESHGNWWDLSHHIADEARHAMWLTDLLVWEPTLATPGSSYIDEFDRLVDREYFDPKRNLEDGMIAALAAINVTEKRGCEYFSAHIHALKQAPKRRKHQNP